MECVPEGRAATNPVDQRMSSSTATEDTSACYDVFVARQPIFQGDGKLVAYELLYRRSGAHQTAEGTSAEAMAAEVLVQTFLSMGIERVTGDSRAFLNFTREMLLNGVAGLFDPKRVVIELLETVQPDDEVISAIDTLSTNGYTVALDDFEYSPAWDAVLGRVKVIKVDVLDRSPADLKHLVQQLSRWSLTLLAERVETREVEQLCKALGFRLFQGYYYQRPEILSKKELSAGQLTILRLMNLLRDPNSSDVQLDDAFRGDVSLTMKLLRTVNSAAMGGRGIESIRHAVRMVGRGELHKWLSLLLVSSVASRGGTDLEVVRVALTRARLAEQVGQQAGNRQMAEALFMVGLFSLLEALLRVPLTEILGELDLAEEIRRALLTRAGPYASTLSLVEAWEGARWDVVNAEATSLGLDPALLGDMYLQSIAWAKERLQTA
jgi:EAL and modified HD-GYP domain-containing signal transduction protein